MTATARLKQALRKELAARLNQIPPASIEEQSSQVFQQLLRLGKLQKSGAVSVYISMPTGEIDTSAIIKSILQAGKSLHVPRCTGSVMEMVKIYSWNDYITLPVNKWRIPEPPLDQDRENSLDRDDFDLILVPGMAFDAEMNRIGHGKGYYDRYFARCQQWAETHHRKPPLTVALALEEQILDVGTIPVEATDRTLDYIITPTRVFAGRSPSSVENPKASQNIPPS